MTSYKVTVPGIPVGKGRPRMTVRGGHARAYTPEKTARYENLVRTAFTQAYPDFTPFDEPLNVFIRAMFPIPKSWPKKKQKSAFWASKKPDIDNVIKSVFDGLNGVAWTDDKLVCELSACKIYTNNMPCCMIQIKTQELNE